MEIFSGTYDSPCQLPVQCCLGVADGRGPEDEVRACEARALTTSEW